MGHGYPSACPLLPLQAGGRLKSSVAERETGNSHGDFSIIGRKQEHTTFLISSTWHLTMENQLLGWLTFS